MNLDEQRRLGMKLAVDADAKETLAAIKDTGKCFEDILKTAAAELGIEKFTSIIQQNDPLWAAKAIRYIPDLGDFRADLIKKAAETQDSALQALRFGGDLGDQKQLITQSAGEFAATLGEISSFEIFNGGGFNSNFTIYWVHENTNYPIPQPPADDNGDGRWAGETMHNNTVDFNIANMVAAYNKLSPSPIAVGDPVQFFMYARGSANNKWHEDPRIFSFNPNGKTAYFETGGGVDNFWVNYKGIA